MLPYLSSNVTALGPELVDLGLSNVSSLFSFFKLMLDLPEAAQVSIGLFLLKYKVNQLSNCKLY